ncbi:MAG: germination protein YpeB [Oscillospiraceae bacterium]|jgi:germination protein YpeB|nr:germination protein YpeB [Oscillospiraceae bacterium]
MKHKPKNGAARADRLRLPRGLTRSRGMTLLAVYALAALAVLSGFIYKSHLANENYKRAVTNGYRSAFNSAAASITTLDNTLQKAAVSGTGAMLTETCTEVYGAAMSAKQALGELPNSDRAFEKTSGFVTRAGDYAFSLLKKSARGEKLSEGETANLKSLSETASVLSQNLLELAGEVNDGRLKLGDLDRLAREADAGDGTGALGGRMKSAEEEFPEMPTLIYDGPFSSHIPEMKPKFLEGKSDVSAADAKKAAEKFTGLSGLSDDGERAGNLPVYVFSAPDGDGSASIEVSKKGGVVVNIYSSRVPSAAATSGKTAAATAAKYLAEHGFKDMRESYRMTTDGVCTVNFAATADGVILYPDLVKVVVALDTGKVSGFEAQGFVMHSHAREIPPPGVTADEARAKVSPGLTVLSDGLAVIPTAGKNEVFCREFKCENGDGRHYVVYINAETGSEERIFVLIEDENGTLAV